MADYAQSIDFSAKDALPTGDAGKAAKGADIDTELALISTAIASKVDESREGQASGIATLGADSLVPDAQLPTASLTVNGIVELATTAETITGTDATRAVTPDGIQAVLDQNAGALADFAAFTDPAADVLFGWDDSASAVIGFTLGAGILHAGTALSIDHDAATNFVADEHVAHSGVSITAGNGLTGGGTIAATRDIALGTPGDTTASSTSAVTANSHTHAAGAGIVKTSPGTGGQITVSTSAASGAATNGDMWLQV